MSIVPLVPTGQLLPKITLLRPGEIYIYKELGENEEAKEGIPNKRAPGYQKRELSKTEISNQLNKEFRVMIIKVLNELRRKSMNQ